MNCPLLYYRHKENKPVLLTVWNQRNREETLLLRIKVITPKTLIIDSNNKEMISEVFCVNPFDKEDCELIFVAPLNAFGLTYFKALVKPNLNPAEIRHFDFNSKTKQDHKLRLGKQNFLHMKPSLDKFYYKFCGN